MKYGKLIKKEGVMAKNTMKNIKIVTLCGSRKFMKEFNETEIFLTKKGFAVLSPIFCDNSEITNEMIQSMGKIHLKKIELSDEIFVIDVNRYIGESTIKEIEYAKFQNKQIRYYSIEIM